MRRFWIFGGFVDRIIGYVKGKTACGKPWNNRMTKRWWWGDEPWMAMEPGAMLVKKTIEPQFAFWKNAEPPRLGRLTEPPIRIRNLGNARG